MNLISTIKSKGLSILCVILATLLTVSILSYNSNKKELINVQSQLLKHVQLNERLSEQNLSLAEEIKNKPKEYITITKEADKKLCDGLLVQHSINSLPSKVKKEAVNENNVQNTADIDDRLPADLIQLLK